MCGSLYCFQYAQIDSLLLSAVLVCGGRSARRSTTRARLNHRRRSGNSSLLSRRSSTLHELQNGRDPELASAEAGDADCDLYVQHAPNLLGEGPRWRTYPTDFL